MTAQHPLSAVETESLRRLRTRLARPAAGEGARQVLGKVFLDTVARVGFDAPADPAPLSPVRELVGEADAADLGALRQLCGRLAHVRATNGAAWSKLLDAGVPNAIISRRLALAGREPAKTAAEETR